MDSANVAKALLSAQADPNVGDKWRRTPLWVAAHNGDYRRGFKKCD